VQEALSLIVSARMSIEAQDLDSARDVLTTAYWAIREVESLIEDEDNNTSNSNSGENSDDDSREWPDGGSEDSDSSDSGSGKEDDEDKGSNKGSNDTEDDQ
jgi:hypothetical protein